MTSERCPLDEHSEENLLGIRIPSNKIGRI
jgi:hypothetical protein